MKLVAVSRERQSPLLLSSLHLTVFVSHVRGGGGRVRLGVSPHFRLGVSPHFPPIFIFQFLTVYIYICVAMYNLVLT